MIEKPAQSHEPGLSTREHERAVAVDQLEADVELQPEDAFSDSLQSALQQLRDDADRLAAAPIDDDKVTAAEQLARQAAALDDQIGAMARKDEG